MPQEENKTISLFPIPVGGLALDLFMPGEIAEQSGLNAWALSTLNLDNPIKVTQKLALSTKFIPFNRRRKRLKNTRQTKELKFSASEAESSGAPLIRENYFEITISDGNNTHGSEADYIFLHFGDGHRIKLKGRPKTKFKRGDTLRWDFNVIQSFMEGIDTDAWDEMMLETKYKDGIKIEKMTLVHSGETILDWNDLVWLDNSKKEAFRYISLTASILQTKLDQIDHNWIAQIHWAAREIGKTDPTKYGTENAWCSEFASWALQKGFWDTPDGNIGSSAMEGHFDDIGRAHQIDEIMDGSYKLNPGDYLRFEWSGGGQHSGIFIDFIDDPNNLTDNTKIKTIEGNTSSTVGVRTSRKLKQVISCGNTH